MSKLPDVSVNEQALFKQVVRQIHKQGNAKIESIDWNSKSADPMVVHGLLDSYAGIVAVLGQMGHNVTKDDNYVGTHARATKALLEMVLPVAEIERQVKKELTASFPARGKEKGMVTSTGNICWGICPHHLLPVLMKITVSYVPDPKQGVLGISKLSRICSIMSKRPVLQEDLTVDIATVLHKQLKSKGSACQISGLHLCAAARGAEAHEVRTITNSVFGIYKTQMQTRSEFLNVANQNMLSIF